MALTEKQKRFGDYYVETGNATEAYKKAGYSWTSDNIAGVEGHKLLKHPKIRAYVDEILGQKDSDRIASQDEVLEFLTSVMRGKVIEKIPILVGAGMQELVENGPSVQVRERAAELLGKRYMLWTDRQQIEGNLIVFKGEEALED